MFYEIGKKIQTVARIATYIGITLSIIAGLVLFGFACNDPDKLKGLFFLAPVAVVVGSLSAWLSSICLYGFGKLIEDTEAIRGKLEDFPEYSPFFERRFQSAPTAPHTNAPDDTNRNASPTVQQENTSSTNPYAPTASDSPLYEAMLFLNQKYNIQIDLSDDIIALKEKIMEIEYVDALTERFKYKVAHEFSEEKIWALIKKHYVLCCS